MTTNPEAGMRPATSQASWANDPRMTAAEASPLNAIRYAVESWEEYGDPADAMTFLEMWEQGDLSESQQYREWCLAAAPVAPAGSDVEKITAFLRERDEALEPGEATDEEREASAQAILDLAARAPPPAGSDALISPAGEVSGWQPIETAPRDAVLLLYGEVGHGRTAEHPRGPIRACGYWDDIDQAWAFTETTWEGPFMAPTHWMPLPAAPRGMEG